MPSTGYRLRQVPFSSDSECIFSGPPSDYFVDLVSGKWRIYESEPYENTSLRGLPIHWCDPNAGAEKGRIAQFATKPEAVAYFKRWLLPHLKEIRRYTRP